jgi:protein subunit release factor B
MTTEQDVSLLPASEQNPTARRMAELGIREEDIEETFVRSGGHGGQNVNKTSTCVMLVHRPTGTQVKCQTTRHQARNRELARTLLLDKIEAARRQQAAARTAKTEKLRRQKRARSRAAKERILATKSKRADTKRLRRSVRED